MQEKLDVLKIGTVWIYAQEHWMLHVHLSWVSLVGSFLSSSFNITYTHELSRSLACSFYPAINHLPLLQLQKEIRSGLERERVLRQLKGVNEERLSELSKEVRLNRGTTPHPCANTPTHCIISVCQEEFHRLRNTHSLMFFQTAAHEGIGNNPKGEGGAD